LASVRERAETGPDFDGVLPWESSPEEGDSPSLGVGCGQGMLKGKRPPKPSSKSIWPKHPKEGESRGGVTD